MTQKLPEIKLLDAMERLIKRGWARGVSYRDSRGRATENVKQAARCCVSGAHHLAAYRAHMSTRHYDEVGLTTYGRTWEALESVCGGSPVSFNDAQRTRQPVLRKIRAVRALILKNNKKVS